MILCYPSGARLGTALNPFTWYRIQILTLVGVALVGLISFWNKDPTSATNMGNVEAVPKVWVRPPPQPPRLLRPIPESVPPFFVLLGDSTTQDQQHNGGGWGGAFSWLLVRGAKATNRGVPGATSSGYIATQAFRNALAEISANCPFRKVFVTIQFGHNDLMPGSGVSLNETQANLVYMARHVLGAGGYPILLSPLARREFLADDVTLRDDLAAYRNVTIMAYEELIAGMSSNPPTLLPLQARDGNSASPETAKADVPADVDAVTMPTPRFVNLNAASYAFIQAIGKPAAYRYNKASSYMADDTTHLNELGAEVFARIVADLLLGHPPALVPKGEKDPWAPGIGNEDSGLSAWIEPHPFYSSRIWHGEAI